MHAWGAELEDLGIEYLFTFGERARHYHDRARVMFAVHFREKNMLAEYLAELLAPGDAVLVKGSRAMKMEDIVTFLSERLSTLPVVPD
jgi:UDP-N-acetylmuramoyl-tripeptide--D-alanyl-D-alanine ligase